MFIVSLSEHVMLCSQPHNYTHVLWLWQIETCYDSENNASKNTNKEHQALSQLRTFFCNHECCSGITVHVCVIFIDRGHLSQCCNTCTDMYFEQSQYQYHITFMHMRSLPILPPHTVMRACTMNYHSESKAQAKGLSDVLWERGLWQLLERVHGVLFKHDSKIFAATLPPFRNFLTKTSNTDQTTEDKTGCYIAIYVLATGFALSKREKVPLLIHLIFEAMQHPQENIRVQTLRNIFPYHADGPEMFIII